MDRRGYVGGTDAEAIMAGDWRRLWRIKTGRAKREDLSHVLPVQIGLATEALNARWFAAETGRQLEYLGDGAGYYQAPEPLPRWMGCHPDGMTVTAKGEPAYWDAKHVGRADDTVVQRYIPQMTHSCLVMGVEWWIISFFIGNSRWEMIEQPLDPIYADDLLERERQFWECVEKDIEPPERIPGLSPPPVIVGKRKVQLEDAGKDKWPNWGAGMVELLGKWASSLSGWKAHEAAKREIKELLPEDVGRVTRGKIRVVRDKAGAVRISLSKEESE